jgi:NAD+ diphosphatase
MCAFEARALSSEITLDPTELAEARWFDRPGLIREVNNGKVTLAGRSAIARAQIERWLGAPLDTP